MKSSIALKEKENLASKAFIRYCSLKTLDTSEDKFCYDAEPNRKEISRMLDMGADAKRICKKINKINPDFCKAIKASKKIERLSTAKSKRGIIYE